MKRVLVVDDEVLLAQIIGEFLQDEGYEVLLAHGRRSMLHLLEQERPDLILLDVMLPDGDGQDVVIEMQSREDLRNVPVVMMSAGVSALNLRTPLARFLRKPFDLSELLSLVGEVIGEATPPTIPGTAS
jgi:DNA-binding response OmpR family regulator